MQNISSLQPLTYSELLEINGGELPESSQNSTARGDRAGKAIDSIVSNVKSFISCFTSGWDSVK